MILGHLDATDATNAADASERAAGAAGHADAAGAAGGHPESLGAGDARRAGVELIADNLRSFEWPLAWGLESGHRSPNLTLPLGMSARLGPDGSGGAGLLLGS